jgi:hypothetical protein
MYLAEKGRIMSAREYKYAMDRPKLLSMKEIVKTMGSYTTAVDWIAKYEPELWDIINGKEPVEPAPAPKSKKPEPKKADPLAALSQGKEKV